MYPLIFNIYSEHIFRKTLGKVNEGILFLNGERIITPTILVDDIITTSYRLDDGGKWIIWSGQNKTSNIKNQNNHLIVNQKFAQQVIKYSYPGTTVNDQWDRSCCVKVRIVKGRTAFRNMSFVFKFTVWLTIDVCKWCKVNKNDKVQRTAVQKTSLIVLFIWCEITTTT